MPKQAAKQLKTKAKPASETSAPRGSGPQTTYLGWSSPILQRTAETLIERLAVGDNWDMRAFVVVLPSSLARRRLAEILALEAERAGAILYPPQIVTVGGLPEHLYVAKYPFASEMVQHLAWMRVLLDTPPTDLAHLVPVPPPKSQTAQWLELAKVLCSIHRELASERLDFASVAKALAEHMGADHPERPRWTALAKIQAAYLQELDRQSLWDVQTARLCALEYNEANTTQNFLVVACVDLNQTQRGFLKAIEDRIEIWVAAPESAKDYFDEIGCLRSEAWSQIQIDVPPELLFVGTSPSDQAELTASCLASFGEQYHAREVTIGVPDSSLISELKHQLAQVEIAARYGPGTPLAQSEPALLLSLVGRYHESRSYPAFAALIRHPAIDNLFRVQKTNLPENWLAQVDNYYQASLPKQIDGFVNKEVCGATVYAAVVKTLDRWLSKLGNKPRPITEFVQPLLGVLADAYDKQMCDLEEGEEGALFNAASQTAACILALRDIPQNLEPEVGLSELVDWLVSNMKSKLVPEPTQDSAVEMLGWLELALDDSPALIVTGMHDGVVPESLNSDAFLPNNLRRKLGMMDNDRRYARDSYSMQVLLGTRRDVRFVVGKTDASGDPLVPSRLLMACSLEQLPARVLHLVREEDVDVLPPTKRRWERRGGQSQIAIPRPSDVEPPTQISVTAFRDYLRCPYRFYLSHVMRLRSGDDTLSELDAPQFGNLIHQTLAELKGPIGTCTDAEELKKFLIENLHQNAAKSYGPNPPAAVLIQIEQAELRLAGLAEKQAERARLGWEVRFVESGVGRDDEVMLGEGKQLRLIGRIDRIDFHPESGQWAIWDYKTSDSAKNPLQVHWSRKHGWQDLQLPLYRAIGEKLGVTGVPTLGYITLPKQATSAGFHVAKFSPELLEEADQVAAGIATRVAEGDFWPEAIESVRYDDFARICQSNVQRVSVDPPVKVPHRADEALIAPAVPKAVVTKAKRLIASPPKSNPDLRPLLIRASAGTGKTFQLSNRLLQIILSGQDVDHILATTFTRKAAGEIMHRVLQRLALGCINEKARGELASHLEGVDTSAANCLASLRRVTASIHRLRISTLDSFFAQVARTFSFEMALPPGWHAMDPVQEPQFQLQAINRMLDNRDRKTLVDLVRMLAKGESGRQVTEQIRQTVAAGYGAFRITQPEDWDQLPLPAPPTESAVESALLTLEATKFGNKSADDQMEKLHLLARTGNWEAVIEHGIYAKLRDDCPKYYRKEVPADLVVALEVLAERAVAELLPLRRNQTLASYKVLEAFDLEYSAMIRHYRLLAFADVTHYLSRWMKPGAISDSAMVAGGDASAREKLEFRLDCGIDHLLLDEFQDTAPDQWNVLQPLATPLVSRSGADKSMFCVGDTKQAIYGWRGGVAEVFNSVTKALPTIEQQELSQSYRSSPEVMEVVNRVFLNLNMHPNFGDCDAVAKSWADAFPTHKTALADLPGYVCLQNGPKVDSNWSSEEKRLAFLEYTADQIAELTSNSSAGVGVLFRTNSDVARMIAILRDRGVSASQDGGNPLTDSVAVELLLSLVHLADHPGDGVCLFHVATSPLASSLPHGGQRNGAKIASWFRQEVTRKGLGRAVEQVADRIAEHLSWWDQHRLEQLIRLAHGFQGSYGGRLREFEEAVEYQRVALPTEAQVKVMTVHKSKGLEFDAVFLPDLEVSLADSGGLLVLRGEDPCAPPTGVLRYMNSSLQAMLPKSWQAAFEQMRDSSVVESLCLLYVAMTRARHALYMTARPTGSAPSQQFGSLLQSTLGSQELTKVPEVPVFELGDSQWFHAAPRKLGTEPAKKSRIEELPVALRTDRESSPKRGLRVMAPSYIGRTFEPIPLRSAFSISHSRGATFGTLIHAFFEQVRWLEDFQLDRNELRRVALAAVSPEELQLVSLDNTLDQFEEMLELPSVRAALSQSRYREILSSTNDVVEVDNERLISLVLDEKIISGTIDRLAVQMRDGRPYSAEIIDFKTDAYDENMSLLWLEDRVGHHRAQLEVYAEVVSRLFRIPLDRISLFLLMLSTDDLVEVKRKGVAKPHVASAPRVPANKKNEHDLA